MCCELLRYRKDINMKKWQERKWKLAEKGLVSDKWTYTLGQNKKEIICWVHPQKGSWQDSDYNEIYITKHWAKDMNLEVAVSFLSPFERSTFTVAISFIVWCFPA